MGGPSVGRSTLDFGLGHDFTVTRSLDSVPISAPSSDLLGKMHTQRSRGGGGEREVGVGIYIIFDSCGFMR